MIGKVELNGKVGEIVRLERDRYILKVRGMGEVSIGAEYLVVPTFDQVKIDNPMTWPFVTATKSTTWRKYAYARSETR
jgi:hypothetical protein